MAGIDPGEKKLLEFGNCGDTEEKNMYIRKLASLWASFCFREAHSYMGHAQRQLGSALNLCIYSRTMSKIGKSKLIWGTRPDTWMFILIGLQLLILHCLIVEAQMWLLEVMMERIFLQTFL